jgi:hypothetical protein
MLNIAHRAMGGFASHEAIRRCLAAALSWLSDNPMVPTDEQFATLCDDQMNVKQRVVEWQRRMFLAPEQKYKDGTVIWKEGTTIPLGVWSGGKMYTTNIPTPEPEVSPSTELHRAFHRAWTDKVGTEGYNKDDWNKLDSLLNRCLYPHKSAE